MKTLGKTMFCEDAQCIAKYLIKPVESNAFWRQNAETAPKINEKALGKQRFQSCKPRTQKALKTLSKTMFCEDAQGIVK